MTKCGSDRPTVNERLISREAPASITLAVVQWYRACDTSRSAYRACDTSRGRRTSVRHMTGSTYERATHRGVDVRACDTSRGRRTRNERSRTKARAGRSMENVVRDNYVKGM